MAFSFKVLFIYFRGLFEMKIGPGSCWHARLPVPGLMLACCEQGWMERHLQVPPPAPGPPLARTADVPVVVWLDQAHTSDSWAASTYSLSMQSSNQRQPG